MTEQGKLRHIVMFSFKPDADAPQVVERFRALSELVPSVGDFEWGANVSSEGLSQGHSLSRSSRSSGVLGLGPTPAREGLGGGLLGRRLSGRRPSAETVGYGSSSLSQYR
jgi:hypothetical protein